LTFLDKTARRPVETRNDRRTSDECPEEDIAAAEFRGCNLHLGSWTILKTVCCHAVLCIASLCVLRTCVHFAIVYRALP